LKILDPRRNANPTEDVLLSFFANKCYGNFSEQDGKKQAKKFLKVLYDDLEYLLKEGPVSALERASQRNIKAGKRMMRIVRLNKPIDGFTMRLDCWLIGETIGNGTSSVVKRGRRVGGEMEEVAIKIITKNGKSFQLSELKQEIMILRALNHKNVIRMYDSFENVQYPGVTEKPTVVMVLELATKGELFDFFMETGSFEPPLARWFFRQMIDGVEYCHNQKIAHRDLKPENLLLGEGFNMKLIDFGFARFFRDEDTGKEVAMKTALGTPGYAAPEILNRQKYDYSVDIFSLGVILFICIAGFPPFQEPKASDWWFHKIITKKYHLFWRAHERVVKFDDDAKDILLGMLAARPADRYRWETLRKHPWTNGKTFTQDEASEALMKRKRGMDYQVSKTAQQKPNIAYRCLNEIEAPILGSFLPVHHLFTSVSGTLARDEVQNFIVSVMYGETNKVPTDLWVGPVPEEGLVTEEKSEAKIDLPNTVSSSGTDELVKKNDAKNEALGFYWQDLDFSVDINAETNELDDRKSDIRVKGRVAVRRHPTMKSENGTPLNVIYLQRMGYVMPHDWQGVTQNIFQGVAHIIERTKTGYFIDSRNKTGLAASAALSLLCCSAGAAKKLAE